MALADFGDDYRRYMETTPEWIPNFSVDNALST